MRRFLKLNLTEGTLRVIAVVAPIAFAVVVGLSTNRVLERSVGEVWAAVLATATVGGGALLFSAFMFSVLERVQRELWRQNEELRALTQAGISLTSELSLGAVLQRLVDLGRDLGECRYAALSVLGPDGRIEQFVTSGITEAEKNLIGPPPTGRGLLGVILSEGSSLRLKEISGDPRSVGFPAHHPPMHSLLGVPVVSRGKVVGNLYLTEKAGTAAFSQRDEEVVRLLATQAAVAIENAQLYESQGQRAEEWKALFELGREVTAQPDLTELLTSIATRARKLLDADISALMLLTGDGSTAFMAAHAGLKTAGMQEMRLLSEHGLQGLVLETGRPVIVEDYQSDERLKNRPAKLVAEEGLVSLISVPFHGKGKLLGTLTVGSRTRRRFTERQAELLESFANWAAVATETSQLYEKLESLARLEERERIGMDLHDGVIQSIYAVGLNLEDAAERLDESQGEVHGGLQKAIDDLSKVIRDIRSYIFDLRPQVSRVSDLPGALGELVRDVRVNTLMDAELKVEGEVDGRLDDERALALFHIAQEALNNVSRHSMASAVRVRLTGEGRSVRLEIEDNGVGFQVTENGPWEKQGIRNMRDRARAIGADLVVDTERGRGTRIRVEVPPVEVRG